MTDPQTARLEDVLDAFTMEETHAKATLSRYLTAYPQFAGDLIDLSRELMRADPPREADLSAADLGKIDAAWTRHAAAEPETAATDPFGSLSPTRSREIAIELGVPRQVVTSFHERRVRAASVPPGFMRRLADALAVSTDAVVAWLAPAPDAGLARSYRSDSQPTPAVQLSFEHVLVDAGVPDADRARLMADGD